MISSTLSFPNNTKSKELVEQGLKLSQTEHIYSAIPFLDKAMSIANPKDIYPFFVSAKVEVLLDASNKFTADYISLCSILKKANAIEPFKFPEILGGESSQKKEQIICTKVEKFTGQELYDLGIKVMVRTKDGVSNKNTIKHALPYFSLAEKKHFNDPELYQTLSLLAFDKAEYSKAIRYSKLFFKANGKKQLYEADVMKIYAMSKLKVNGFSKENVKIAINDLKKAQALGSAESTKLIKNLANVLSKSDSKNVNCTRVSSDYALWQYCTNGDCNGFSSNYNLWKLCQNNDYNSMSSNYTIWKYLKEGDVTGLSSDLRVWNSAKEHAGSFNDRKEFVIYYLRGFIFQKI
jgi:hypothetical protein